jgi:hypothetical protein
MYSRALQTNTDHYYRITCTGDTAPGVFRTQNIPLGQTWTDPLPYDPDNLIYHGSGYYAYPQFGASDDEAVVDPQTGALLKRWTKAAGGPVFNWAAISVGSIRDPNAAWGATEAELLTKLNVDDANYVTYTSASQDLLVIVPASNGVPFTQTTGHSLSYVTISVIGWGVGADADRTLEACMTLDAVSCYGPWVDIVLPAADPGATPVTTATTTPYLFDWTAAGKQPPGPEDMKVRSSGTVAVSGTTVTASASGAFLPTWTNGSRITINGTVYRIGSVTDDKTLELTSAPGDGSGLTWSAFNFGFLLRKKTATADQITLDRITFGSRDTDQATWPTSGSEDVCAWVESTRNGVPGYHCFDRYSSVMYWVSAIDGTSKLLGAAYGTPPGATAIPFRPSGLDPSHQGRIFALTTGGTPLIAKWEYTGTNQEDLTGVIDGQDGGLIAGGKATITTLTPSPRDFYTLVNEFSLTSPVGGTFVGADLTSGCALMGVQPGASGGSAILFRCLRGGPQDVLGWVVVFDPDLVSEAAGCVGGGSPGCVIAAISSMRGVSDISQGSPLFHWGMLHYVAGQGANGWTSVSPNWNEAWNTKAGGHYYSTVIGTVPPEATQITVAAEPADSTPAGGETGAPGEYTTLSPGDILCLTNTAHHVAHSPACGWAAYNNVEEAVRVTAKSYANQPEGCTPGVDCYINLTVERNKN